MENQPDMIRLLLQGPYVKLPGYMAIMVSSLFLNSNPDAIEAGDCFVLNIPLH